MNEETRKFCDAVLRNKENGAEALDSAHRLGFACTPSEVYATADYLHEKCLLVDPIFVSYDGAYPNLCSGKLVFKLIGVEIDTWTLTSTGGVSFDDDWNEQVHRGPWDVEPPSEELPIPDWLVEAVRELVNENVSQGCCGGCV